MDETNNIIKEQYKKLPRELKSLILSPTLKSDIVNIVKGQPLQQIQIDAFGVEVVLVLLQLESIAAFGMNLKRNMQISQPRADEIVRNTRRTIFQPVEEFLIPDDIISEEGRPVVNKQDVVPVKQSVFTPPTNKGVEGIAEKPHEDIYREPAQSASSKMNLVADRATQQQRSSSTEKPAMGNMEIQKRFTPTIPKIPNQQTPQPAPQTQQKQVRGPYDPYKEPPAEKTGVIGDTHPSTPAPHSLEVFRERLTKQVSAPVEQVILAEKKKERPLPPTKEQLAKDPYRETVD